MILAVDGAREGVLHRADGRPAGTRGHGRVGVELDGLAGVVDGGLVHAVDAVAELGEARGVGDVPKVLFLGVLVEVLGLEGRNRCRFNDSVGVDNLDTLIGLYHAGAISALGLELFAVLDDIHGIGRAELILVSVITHAAGESHVCDIVLGGRGREVVQRADRGDVAGELGGHAAGGGDTAEDPGVGALRGGVVVLDLDVGRGRSVRSRVVGLAHDAARHRAGGRAGVHVLGDRAAVTLLTHDAAGRLRGGLDGAGVRIAGDHAPREAHDAASDVVRGGDGTAVGAARDLEVGGAGRVAVGTAHDAAGDLAVRRDGRSVRAAGDFVFRAEHAAHDAARGLEGDHAAVIDHDILDRAAVHEADRGAGVVALGGDADVRELEVPDRASLDNAEQAGAHGVAGGVGVSRSQTHA